MQIQIDVEIDELSTFQFVWMTYPKGFLSIVPCTDAEGLATLYAKGWLSVGSGNFEPSNVTTVSIVLRMFIVCHVVGQGHLVSAEKSGTLAVGIVFPGTTAVVLDVGVVGRQTHPHAELGHQRYIGGGRNIVHVDHDTVVVSEGISESEVCANWQ